MAKPLNQDKPKIQMLLDIENIFGESTRGLGQFVLTLLLILVPPLFIGWTSLYLFVPWQLLLVVCLFWAVRVTLIVMGRERQRLQNFKKQRDDAYALADSMSNVRTIHPQGCIEYVNGGVGFFVVTCNDSSGDVLAKSKQIDRFINLAVGKHPFDIYIQNINDTKALDNRYSKVTLFTDDEAAHAFMDIIDYNSKLVSSCSTLTRNILFVCGSKYQWKDILSDIETALNSEAARIFRLAYLVTDKEEIEDIISRDIDGCINLDEMLQKKYYTGDTHKSKIISYDFQDVKDYAEENRQKEEEDVTGFLPRM